MVRTGLQQWIDKPNPVLQTMRLGLVSMPAAVLPNLTHAIDALQQAGYRLTALFGPEHGLRGAAADGMPVEDFHDPHSGLPVYSLYGSAKQPAQEALALVDALVFDMQDVGVRFYTYISTLFYLLKAAAQAEKPVFVLDRPNPISGVILEGGAVEPGFESFVGVVNLPIRHGMTPGELAQFMNAEYALGAELRVVPMVGWQRRMWFDESGLLWVPTSPAMPHLSTATLYPGMCLLEGTNLSLGRGTSLPFAVCGAPWLNGYALAEEMNRLELPGVRFRPIFFTPWASNHAGVECQGIQVHITDRQVLRPVRVALHLLAAARRMSGEAWAWNPHFERLTGSSGVRSAIETGIGIEEILSRWENFVNDFIHQREKYLLYE